MDIESLIAAASRAQQASEHNIGNCSRIWHVGFFFDGLGRNIEQDVSACRLSNVARLYRAYPSPQMNNSHCSYDALYFSGLGTPFHEDLTTKLHTLMDSAQDITLDDLKDQPKEMAKDAGKEILKGNNWYEVLKESGKKLLNPTEWRNLVTGIGTDIVKKVGIEAMPCIRDNPLVADILVTGVDTRITSAKVRFKEYFEKAKASSEVPIKLISISLFGFDLGATLVRKFIDEFLGEMCQKQGDNYTWQGIPVDIIFTGLFDCSRDTAASSNNGLDYVISAAGGPLRSLSVMFGRKYIDHFSVLPEAVKNALHLVAAHERRVWRCLYRLGSNHPKHREELMPGCCEDIGGGLKPGEQKPSAELCRVALQRMYREATIAGVQFPDFRTLQQVSETVASYFIMQDNVKNASVEQWVQRYQKAVRYKAVSPSTQNLHLDSYFEWLGLQYYQYRCERQQLEKHQAEITLAACSSAGLLGITPQGKEQAMNVQDKIEVLDRHWGWLNEINDAAHALINTIENPGPRDTQMRLFPDVYEPAYQRAKWFHQCRINAYLGEAPPQPWFTATPEIFAYFVHDLITVDRGASISRDFLVVRASEIPQAE
ncbi:DUF2235 domain-containing protein [Cronobacter sakazakii]|nr:DUF2235 domain-containing protein [Cronobacter sakazakii]ELY4406581.1 DUF2235 domain-containing protein [Cronobacter sakazakii]ELY4465665.1 DUF2235 domain-containing protein [Cronobacter sakazakii]ELY5898206.1 DUF2235 domain-containing protein [Cronobacter sakazakii]